LNISFLSQSFLIILFVLFGASCTTSPPDDKQLILDDELKVLVRTFFSNIDNPQVAHAALFKTNDWFKDNPTAAEELVTKMEKINALLGEFNGFQKIQQSNAGKDYIHLAYLLKYDFEPVKTYMTFYRPKDKWQLQVISHTLKLNDEITRTSELHLIESVYENKLPKYPENTP